MGDPVLDINNDPLSTEGLENIFDLAPVTCAEVTGAEPVTTAKEPVTPDSQPVLTSADNDNRLVAIIENQAHQLKAAGDVIMYLRSQIEEKETQLKLLTDSQHKRHWWTSFCSWFLGRTTELP
jgi:hypothetical protein